MGWQKRRTGRLGSIVNGPKGRLTRTREPWFAVSPRTRWTFAAHLSDLEATVAAWKADGIVTVLTMGSFDLLHTGHLLYLEKAKSFGDRLIVGLDSDAKVRQRKGPGRPLFDERERVHRVTHLHHVDAVVLKEVGWARWELPRRVHPDVLVASAGVYTNDDLHQVRSLCGRLEVLQRHPETPTDSRLVRASETAQR